VTGSKDERCWAEARRYATRVLVKTDVARDFGSWAIATEHCREMFLSYSHVLWVNDSIYFPLIDPKPLFEKMEGLDFWGLVDSHLESHHVMSWFWAFGRQLIQSNFFDRYLRDFSPRYSKWEQIRNFEMRYPGMIRQSGYKTGSWMEADRIIAAVRAKGHNLGRSANVMHNAWRLAIEEFHCPAMKVELLRDNPLGIDIADILNVIEQNTDYDPSLITGHMRRIKAGHIFG
jgi:lipopolysaccharide biosynthesis protein